MTMMIRCMAIDDEPLALRQLKAYLEKVPYFELVGCCRSALEAARLMETEPTDVLFIDINMPDLNGLDFVRSLSHPPLVVFTTAYHEYAIEGYKVNAVDYLLKPFGMADVMRAADKVKRQYELVKAAERLGDGYVGEPPVASQAEPVDPVTAAESHAAASALADDNVIFLKTDHKVVRVVVDDIVYVEGMSEYLRIHLDGHDKPLVVLLSMKKLEERLTPHNFLRIHKSYIINMHHFLEMNRTRVTLDNQVALPFGDSYREKLNSYITSKLLGR